MPAKAADPAEGDAEAALAEARAVLYALTPADFTAARNARATAARESGDRDLAEQIRKLAKPAAAAWAVNLLVRAKGEEVEALLELGDALRQAQEALDPDDLRKFSAERSRVVSALARTAVAVVREAGGSLPSAAVSAIEETLRAAVADPGAAAAVRGGALTTPLSYAGMGELPAAGATRRPPAAEPKTDQNAEADRAAARQAAERELKAAERRLAAAQKRASSAADDVERRTAAAEELRSKLAAAEDALDQASASLTAAEDDVTGARAAVEAAQLAVDS